MPPLVQSRAKEAQIKFTPSGRCRGGSEFEVALGDAEVNAGIAHSLFCRRALSKDPRIRIVNVRGTGYKLIAEFPKSQQSE